MRFWRKNVGRDSVIANQVGSCTSLEANASAIFEYLLDLGTVYLILEDPDTGQEKGYVRFFLSLNEQNEPAVFIDSADGKANEGGWKPIKEAEDYIKEFAVKSGIKPENVISDRGGIKSKVGDALTYKYTHHSSITIPEHTPDSEMMQSENELLLPKIGISKETPVASPQIGKRAGIVEESLVLSENRSSGSVEVVDTESGKAIGQLEINKIEPIHPGELMGNMVQKIGGMKTETHGNLAFLIMSLFTYSENIPDIYTFDTLFKDLGGFTSAEPKLIALHKDLIDNPVALFHEMGEYLVKIGVLTLELNWDNLIITANGVPTNLQLTRPDALKQARKNPANPHYLLRALQREIFGDKDIALTKSIKESQGDDAAQRVDENRISAVSMVINRVDNYVTAMKNRLKLRQERLERWKTIPKAPEVIVQKDRKLVVSARESLKEAEDFRREFDEVTDFKSAVEVIRRSSVPPTSLQEEVLDTIKRVVRGFDKDIVIFVDKASLLARVFDIEKDNTAGVFIRLARKGDIWEALILIDKDRKERLDILSTIVHEHWHRMDNIRRETAIGRYIGEGITSSLEKASVKKILQGKSKVARLIKEEYEQNRHQGSEGAERLIRVMTKTDIYDLIIDPIISGYGNERKFVDMLFGSGMFSPGLGKEVRMQVYTTGDLSPVQEFLGERFYFLYELAEYMESDVFQNVNKAIHRLMWAILVDSSFTERRFGAFSQGIAIFKQVTDEIYGEEDFDNPAEFNQVTRSIDFYAMIKKYADKFILLEIGSAEFEVQLSEEISSKIMAAVEINEALDEEEKQLAEKIFPFLSAPRPVPKRTPKPVLEAI